MPFAGKVVAGEPGSLVGGCDCRPTSEIARAPCPPPLDHQPASQLTCAPGHGMTLLVVAALAATAITVSRLARPGRCGRQRLTNGG